MSDLDDKQPEMAEMLNKMTKYNKNVKVLMDLMNIRKTWYIYISEK